MLAFSVIMLFVAVLFAGLGIAIYRGKTDLIIDYHQANVKDKAAYGKAFGKAMLVLAAAFLLSGVIGLFDRFSVLAVLVLVIGLAAGTGRIVVIQIRYNKGLF